MRRQRYIQLEGVNEDKNKKLKNNAGGLDHRDGRKRVKKSIVKKESKVEI